MWVAGLSAHESRRISEQFSHSTCWRDNLTDALMEQSTLDISWMGTSRLYSQDAERELAALRAKPMLRTGLVQQPRPQPKISCGAAGGYRRMPAASAVLPRTPSAARPQLQAGRGRGRGKLTADQAIAALEEEVGALRQAILHGDAATNSDYSVAQESMKRMIYLESALWEAHKSDGSAKTAEEMRKMQRAQELERMTLVSDINQRRARLEQSCRQRVHALRRAHETRWASYEREPAISSTVRGMGEESEWNDEVPSSTAATERPPLAATEAPATKAGTLPPPPPAAATSTTTLPTITEYQQPRPQRKGATDVDADAYVNTNVDARMAASLSRGTASKGVREEEGMNPAVVLGQSASAVVDNFVAATAINPAAPVAVAAIDLPRNHKALLELRTDLRRNLAAVANFSDGDRHLEEITRIMHEIEKLEALNRQEDKIKGRGGQDKSQKSSAVQQKQVKAQEIQKDKHERLRRALEYSGAEELRLLSVRHSRAVGRFLVGCRADRRRRETELRRRLAAVKGRVAHAWREHNKICCRSDPLTGTVDGGGKPRAPAAREGLLASPPPGQQHDVSLGEGECGGTSAPGSGSEKGGRTGDGGGVEARRNGAGTAIPSSGGRGLCAFAATASRAVFAASSANTNDKSHGNGTAPPSPVLGPTKQGEREQTRTASSPSAPRLPPSRPAASSRSGSRRVLRRKKQRASTATDKANELPVGTEIGAIPAGPITVLSNEEASALAALGRGAPSDPRLLLLAPPLPPQTQKWQQPQQPQQQRQPWRPPDEKLSWTSPGDTIVEGTQTGAPAKADGHSDSRGSDKGGDDNGGLGSDECAGHGMLRGYHNKILDRAADKLARKIQAEEDLSRRRLGMPPLPAW